MAELVKCSVCQRVLKGRLPLNGDGSGGVPYKHKDPSGKACDGQYGVAEWYYDKEGE